MIISAVILTKNEESNIERAISSCLSVCDEILVIDSGSTDKTKEIASQFEKVKFIETIWKGFSETKNFGNAKASGDYILSLDADEALDETLQTEILAHKNNLSGAYKFARLTNYCGKWIHHSGWRPDYQTRLFPKQDSKWNMNLVHEKIILPENCNVQVLKGDILHYSYKSISEHLVKMDSYTTLSAQMLLQKDPSFLVIKAVLHSKFKFFRTYILKLGILDGYYGFVISCFGAFVVFLKYIKAAQMKRDLKSKS
ncbi:MAG: glycosyltransferase family 2 protein [Bdellovibrionales bacterium]|nr:glycosyltransferase family 2 protein [Bdellovibrionales bacterium]